MLTCNVNGGRELPSHDQLLALLSRGDISLTPGGELTDDIDEPRDPAPQRTYDVAVMTDDAGVQYLRGTAQEAAPRRAS